MDADTEKQITLAHRALRLYDGITRDVDRLHKTPVSIYAQVSGDIAHGIDFVTFDKVRADVAATTKKHGRDALVIAMNDEHSWGGITDLLEGARQLIAPLRGKP